MRKPGRGLADVPIFSGDMGHAIESERFSQDQFDRFAARLAESLEALSALLRREGFGVGPSTVGAELEMHLVDAAMRPLQANRKVLDRIADPRLVPELGRFNLECNPMPCRLAGRPFSALRQELESAWGEARRAATELGGRVALVGVLPTLRREDLGLAALTELPRYRVLAQSLRAHRDRPFELHIAGPAESLAYVSDDVTPASATTSLQFHLRVDPADFARMFNAAQLATAPVLAASGNSPIFLGRKLWQETRIALFGQLMDDRTPEDRTLDIPSRVGHGQGWVRDGAFELFAESVALHLPMLPVLSEESPLEVVEAGGVPQLAELRLHHGTVWNWNRPVYDPAGGGHLRIEFRALPAGPSLIDMLANGAFLLGLTLALAAELDDLLPGMPFQSAVGNFQRAARFGLDAQLLWPAGGGAPPRRIPVREAIEELLPKAEAALVEAGVEVDELRPLFEVMADRVRTGQTGARWQLATLERLEASRPREEALREMLERYVDLLEEGLPVHRWPVG